MTVPASEAACDSHPRLSLTVRASPVCEPRTVRRFPFRADYRPPPPADGLTNRRREPEEIEREIRQQEAEM